VDGQSTLNAGGIGVAIHAKETADSDGVGGMKRLASSASNGEICG
jgi:hypothetical protein